jgi:hypothetical protein
LLPYTDVKGKARITGFTSQTNISGMPLVGALFFCLLARMQGLEWGGKGSRPLVVQGHTRLGELMGQLATPPRDRIMLDDLPSGQT